MYIASGGNRTHRVPSHQASRHTSRFRRASRLVSILVAAVLVAGCAVLAGPSVGAAYARTLLPPAMEENFSSVQGQLEKGGIPNGRDPVACDDVCNRLVESERGSVPTAKRPLLDKVRSQLYRTRRVLGRLLPKVTRLGFPLLAVTGAVSWYKVYKDVRAQFVGVQIPAQPTPDVSYLRFVEKGDYLGVMQGATYPAHNFIAPEDGKLGTTSSDGAYAAIDVGGDGWCSYQGTIEDATFGGFGSVSDTGHCRQYPGRGTVTTVVAFQPGIPLQYTDSLDATVPYSAIEWPQPGEGTNGEASSTTTDRIRSGLEDNPDDYRDFIAHTDCVLGGQSIDPTGQCVHMPSCDDISYSTCVTRLHDAGLEGTITKKTLNNDDAVMEYGAGHTTGTSPAKAGTVQYDDPITVYVNPDPMPSMTAVETLIAEGLKTKNPGVVSDENKKTIARACARLAQGANRAPSDCGSIPVFVVGYDAAGPADNDAKAIERNALWALLHRRDDTTGVTTSRTWYSGRTQPEPGCPTDGAPADMLDPQCDEYPYFKTLQAYDGALNNGPGSMVPSIRFEPAKENGLEGRALAHFFSSNKGGSLPSSWPFDGCDVPRASDATIKALGPAAGYVAAEPSAFFVIPLGAHTPIPTVGFCNKPTSP